MRPRMRLAIPAAMFSILSTAISCSYGDDEDDDKKDDGKKAEAVTPSLTMGLQAAQQPQDKAKGRA